MIPEFFLTQLKIKSGIPLSQADAGSEFEPLYNTETLEYLLNEASLVHSSKLFMENLENAPYVFLLARKEIYTILAGAFAKNYDIGSRDGKLSKSQPHEHYLDLVKQMEIQYMTLTKDNAVRTTPVLLTNKSRRYLARNYRNAPNPVVSMYIVDNIDEYVSFKLSAQSSVEVSTFDIYLGDSTIYDMFESPPISETSILVQSKVPFTSNTYRVPKNGRLPQYIGVLTRNKYGRQYFMETFIGSEAGNV